MVTVTGWDACILYPQPPSSGNAEKADRSLDAVKESDVEHPRWSFTLPDSHRRADPRWIEALPDLYKVMKRYLMLTDKEFPRASRVFRLFLFGYSNREIGNRLLVSESLVSKLLPFYLNPQSGKGSLSRRTSRENQKAAALFHRALVGRA